MQFISVQNPSDQSRSIQIHLDPFRSVQIILDRIPRIYKNICYLPLVRFCSTRQCSRECLRECRLECSPLRTAVQLSWESLKLKIPLNFFANLNKNFFFSLNFSLNIWIKPIYCCRLPEPLSSQFRRNFFFRWNLRWKFPVNFGGEAAKGGASPRLNSIPDRLDGLQLNFNLISPKFICLKSQNSEAFSFPVS